MFRFFRRRGRRKRWSWQRLGAISSQVSKSGSIDAPDQEESTKTTNEVASEQEHTARMVASVEKTAVSEFHQQVFDTLYL